MQKSSENEYRSERTIIGVGEAGVIISTAQMLIMAGYRNKDQTSIDAGMRLWQEVWPKNVVVQVASFLKQESLES